MDSSFAYFMRAPEWQKKLCRRQPHSKACTEHLRLGAGRGDTDTIFHPDAAAMRLEDLFRNRQAEPGILSEALMRPVGVEALEDFLQRIGLNAGPVVVDDNLDF